MAMEEARNLARAASAVRSWGSTYWCTRTLTVSGERAFWSSTSSWSPAQRTPMSGDAGAARGNSPASAPKRQGGLVRKQGC